MNQISTEFSPLSRFGSATERVARAVAQIKSGGGVIVVDDEDRENEGDIIYPAETITNEQMSLLIRECSGIVCVVLTGERLKALDLPPMVEENTSRNCTAFTVTIEAKQGVTTGVSAADRVTTIHTAIADASGPENLARPGHVFPLCAHPGGILARRGHTEATLELMVLAGRKPAGVLCEVMNPDGTMARLAQLSEVAQRLRMPMVTIEDLVRHKTGR
jgi:3,4-dihydroxy 2-butanone 4-phosphate synthase